MMSTAPALPGDGGMAGFVQGMAAMALLIAAMAAVVQRQGLSSHGQPQPARQIAHDLALFHRAVVTAKLSDPALAGHLSIMPPVETGASGQGFAACADASYVVSYTTAAPPVEARAVEGALFERFRRPPGIGHAVIGIMGAGIQTPYGMMAAPCVLPPGQVLIVTKVFP